MNAGSRLRQLEECDISSLSWAETTAVLRDLSVVKGKTAQIEAELARRMIDLHRAGEAVPAADALGRNGRSSRHEAEKAERRAEALGCTPRLDAALGKGKVGSEHADALANAASRLDDDQREALFGRDQEITELAATHGPETFRRRLGKLVDDITADDGLDRAAQQDAAATASIKKDDETGMHKLFAKLTPEQGNRIRRALDAEVAAMSKLPEFANLRRDQLAARALDRLIAGKRASRSMGPAEVAVFIDYRTLVEGRRGDTVCEYSDGSPIPAETARRHACDAGIIPVVLNGDGQPLDVGRSSRLATPAQRIALRSMYRTCAIGGCDQHFDTCDIHHVDEWGNLGHTNLGRLLPLCSFHHHRAHEGRWRLELDPSTRQLTVTLPTGSVPRVETRPAP